MRTGEKDETSGFQVFGIGERAGATAKNLKVGDVLLTYVSSGISAFADAREVSAEGLRKLGLDGDYDQAFPWAVTTKPLLVLPREKWVDVRVLCDSLEFLRGKRSWGQAMRFTLKKVGDRDGKLVFAAIQRAMKASRAKGK